MKSMSSKKRVVLGLSILGIIMISVIGINAGLFEWFFGNGNGEGELPSTAPAKAFVNVTGTANPPQIVFVSLPTNQQGAARDLNLGPAMTDFNFSFLVNTTAGIANLPGVTPGNDVSPYIIANFTNRATGATRYRGRCIYVGTVTYAGYQAKNYSCNITMQFYDEPISAWNLSVVINDSYANPSNVNKSINFTIPRLWGMTLYPAGVNWSDVKIGQVNLISDDNLTVQNQGNVDIENSTNNYLRINATALQGRLVSTEYLGATNFSAGEPIYTQPCGEPRFYEANWRNLNLTVRHSASQPGLLASKNLTFCLKEVIYVSPQDFNTINNWVLENNVI
jgi:hypothetical protein